MVKTQQETLPCLCFSGCCFCFILNNFLLIPSHGVFVGSFLVSWPLLCVLYGSTAILHVAIHHVSGSVHRLPGGESWLEMMCVQFGKNENWELAERLLDKKWYRSKKSKLGVMYSLQGLTPVFGWTVNHQVICMMQCVWPENRIRRRRIRS